MSCSVHRFKDGKWCCKEIEDRKADISRMDTVHFGFQQGRQNWGTKPSIKEQEKQAIADIRAGGYEPERPWW